MTAVFERILEMSLTAAVVIVVVMLIRLLLRKAPRKYSYALWSVAAFRLVCPVSFRAFFSLFNFTKRLDQGSVETILPDPVVSPTPVVSPGYFDSAPPNTGAPVEIDPDYVFTYYPVTTPPAVETPAAPVNWVQIAAVIWLVCLAALLIYGIVSYVRLRRRMDTAVRMEGNVWQSDRVQSPFILGFVRPKIYLPFGLSADQQRYVLAHERYHIKRFDHIVRPLSFLILAVHWFNPLVWVAYYMMGRDMEMSCDEKVLATEENIRKAYSTTLLSFAANRRFPSPSPLAFGESGVKGRIKNALNWKKPRTWVTIIAILVCVVVIVVCAANPREVSAQTEKLLDWCATQTTEDVDMARVYVSGHWEEMLLSEEEKETIVSSLHTLSKDDLKELENGGDWFYGDAEVRIDTSWGELVYTGGQLFTFWIRIEGGTCTGVFYWEIKNDGLMQYVAGTIGGFNENLQNSRTPQEWAEAISAENVQWAELMINGEERIYRSLTEEEIEALVMLINNGWTSFSAPPKNAGWAFPTERSVTLCCGGIEYVLNLGPDPMTIICKDDRVNWKGEDTWFFTSETVKDYIRKAPEQVGLDEVAQAEYLPYVSVECIYMNPVSPQEPSPESGKSYLIGEQVIAILDKNDNDAGLFFLCPAPWRPLTEAIWVDLFMDNKMPEELSLESYSNPRYRHLSNDYTLLDMDGELWMIELEPGLNKIGMIWNIYRLACASETVTLAQWQADVTGDGVDEIITVEGTLAEDTYVAATIALTYASGERLWSDGFSLGSDEVADFYLVERDGSYAILEWTAREASSIMVYDYRIIQLDGSSAGMRSYWLRCGLTDEELLAMDLGEVRDYFDTVQAMMESGTLLLGGTSGEIVYSTLEKPFTTVWPSPLERLSEMREQAKNRDDELPQTLAVHKFADLTHDGVRETLTLTYQEELGLYTLTVANAAGETIWTGEASTMHAGEAGFYLYQRDNKYYLMQWNPYGSTGGFYYHYEVFSLTEEGGEVPLVSNTMEFVVMNEQTLLQLDIGALRAFEKEVNALLEDTIMLISTYGGVAQYSTETVTLCKLWTSMADSWERGQWEILNSIEKLGYWFADLTHDGKNEIIEISRKTDESTTYYLDIRTTDGTELWRTELYDWKTGWNGYYLYEREGKHYLLEWFPNGQQGWYNFSYKIYRLNEGAEPEIVEEDSLLYDLGASGYRERILTVDVEPLRAFEKKINALLQDAEVLLVVDENRALVGSPKEPVYDHWESPADEWENSRQAYAAQLPLAWAGWEGDKNLLNCVQEQTKLRMGSYELAYIDYPERITTAAMGATDGYLIYRVEYRPADYDASTHQLTWHENEYFYLVTHEVWGESTGPEDDEWHFVGTLSEAELQRRFNTPDMLAQYGDLYTAAAVEMVSEMREQTMYQYLMGFITEAELKAAGMDLSKGSICDMEQFDPDVGGTSRGLFLYRLEYAPDQGGEVQVYYMAVYHVWADEDAGQTESHNVMGILTEEELYSRYDRDEILAQYGGDLHLAAALELYSEWESGRE